MLFFYLVQWLFWAKSSALIQVSEHRSSLGMKIKQLLIFPQTSHFKTRPKITKFLKKESKEHYEKVKKYLDLLGVPYEEDHKLVR